VPLTLDEYQSFARATAIYNKDYEIVYPALKLAGEAGEVAEKIGKCLRDNDGEFDGVVLGAIAKELGDVMWYVANLAEDCGYTLQEIGEMNLAKLKSRQERGVIGGSGDAR
jgi:NTP pyrophosphatase (non-canonical NTP hydrolase)